MLGLANGNEAKPRAGLRRVGYTFSNLPILRDFPTHVHLIDSYCLPRFTTTESSKSSGKKSGRGDDDASVAAAREALTSLVVAMATASAANGNVRDALLAYAADDAELAAATGV